MTVNWNNPITKGLLFDSSLVEGGLTVTHDTISKIAGNITGTLPTLDNSQYGRDIIFADNTNRIEFVSLPLQNSIPAVTVETLCYPTAVNAAGDGRMIHKGPSTKYFAFFYATGNVFQFETDFSTLSGTWKSNASTPANAWYHAAVTYVLGNTANVPIFYINGLPTTLTTINIPSGTPPTDSTTLGVGNRPVSSGGGQAKGFVGKIAYVRYWNRILSPTEMRQLYLNPWQIYRRVNLFPLQFGR